jgi:putative transposase
VPRRARVVFPGLPHHVTQRGNNRQQLFFAAADYQHYLELLDRYARRCGVHVLGYCLMPNHVHLIAAPEQEDSLARALGRTHSEFALALNRAEGRTGHAFQNRFFSCVLSGTHLARATRYVELNPVRAGLSALAWEWPWSSAAIHTAVKTADPVLCADWIGYFGQWDYGEWKELLLEGGGDMDEAIRRATRTGEPLGPRDFVAGLERKAGRRLRVLERGRPKLVAQSSEERARQGCLFQAGRE